MINITERMLKSKENKWEYKKLKIFCTAKKKKKKISKMKRQPTECEKYCKPNI